MHTHHQKSRFLCGVVISLVTLTACAPSSNDGLDPAHPAAAAPEIAQATEPHVRLDGLQVANFGPNPLAVRRDGEPEPRIDVWASADRNLSGSNASLWLDGSPLANRAIAGATVTGSVPDNVLTTPGAYALEIRVTDADGEVFRSEAVTLNVE